MAGLAGLAVVVRFLQLLALAAQEHLVRGLLAVTMLPLRQHMEVAVAAAHPQLAQLDRAARAAALAVLELHHPLLVPL
jgi:hypothetical protein